MSNYDATWNYVQRKAGSHLLEPSDDLRFVALALAGEAGELANLVKKEWRGDELDAKEWRGKVQSEICDVAGYAFMAACIQGFDLLDETYKKLVEVEQRPAFKALLDRQRHKKLAGEVNRMLGPIPPSELAKMQEKGEAVHAQGSGAAAPPLAVNDANWDMLAHVATRVPMVAISQAKFDELKDKAWRYDQCNK